MARKAKVTVVPPNDRQKSYGLRFTANGRRRWVTLGLPEDGWDDAKAEKAAKRTAAQIELGQWEPATPDKEEAAEPTFHEFASEWFERWRHGVKDKTRVQNQWLLSHLLLPTFKDVPLSEITAESVDNYRVAQVRARERLVKRRAAEAKKPAEKRKRLPRPCSNTTINRSIKLMAQILDDAVEYGRIPANPSRGKKRLLKADRPSRTYLDSASQIVALLDAAGDMDRARRTSGRRKIDAGDAEAIRRRVEDGETQKALADEYGLAASTVNSICAGDTWSTRDGGATYRRALLAVLVFAGLRIGEALAIRWRDVDLAGGWIHVADSKTDAGVRKVKIRPVLRDELLAIRPAGAKAAAFVFATSTGRPYSQGNIRTRVLEPAQAAANAKREEAGEAPLPRVTPHGLRRTFASLLFAIGEQAPVVMQEMGHTQPGLVLKIYAQVMRRSDDENQALRDLVNGQGLAGSEDFEGFGASGEASPERRKAA